MKAFAIGFGVGAAASAAVVVAGTNLLVGALTGFSAFFETVEKLIPTGCETSDISYFSPN